MRRFGKSVLLLVLLGLLMSAPRIVVAEEAPAEVAPSSSRLERITSLVNQREAQAKNKQLNPVVSEEARGPEGSGLGLRVLEGLALCLGALFAGLGLYRKFTGDRPMVKGRRMRVVERVMIAPKTSLVLARVDGKEIVLAVGDKVSFLELDTDEQYINEMDLVCRDVVEQQSHSAS